MKNEFKISIAMPLWCKPLLTIQEAVELFPIGEGKIRKLSEAPGSADFILKNGNRILIKKDAFIAYLTKQKDI